MTFPLAMSFAYPPNWPVLLIGLIVGIYWYRVLRMVRKARKQTGRDANFVPRESLGKLLRYVWFPVVGIWIAHPLLSAFLVNPAWFLRPLFVSAGVIWIAAAIAILAYVLTRICWKRMGKSWRMGIDPGEKTALVITGPFAYVRHPIYALSSLLMLATMAAVASPLMFAIGAIHLALLQWEARREEEHMLTTHGLMYAEYRRRTGRFVPKFSTSLTASKAAML